MGSVSGRVGPIVSRQNVEQAVLSTLQIWFEVYLQEIEKQNSIHLKTLPRPAASDSFYGGVDAFSWREDMLPVVIVNAKPLEETERRGSGEYDQWFEVQIATVVQGDDEDSSRALADWYGATVMTIIAQKCDLGGFATNTRMVNFPETSFANDDPDVRVFHQATQMFHVLVRAVVNDSLGAVLPTPPPGDIPIVTSTNLDFEAVPVTEDIADADPQFTD